MISLIGHLSFTLGLGFILHFGPRVGIVGPALARMLTAHSLLFPSESTLRRSAVASSELEGIVGAVREPPLPVDRATNANENRSRD